MEDIEKQMRNRNYRKKRRKRQMLTNRIKIKQKQKIFKKYITIFSIFLITGISINTIKFFQKETSKEKVEIQNYNVIKTIREEERLKEKNIDSKKEKTK